MFQEEKKMKVMGTGPAQRIQKIIQNHPVSKEKWAFDCTSSRKKLYWIFHPPPPIRMLRMPSTIHASVVRQSWNKSQFRCVLVEVYYGMKIRMNELFTCDDPKALHLMLKHLEVYI